MSGPESEGLKAFKSFFPTFAQGKSNIHIERGWKVTHQTLKPAASPSRWSLRQAPHVREPGQDDEDAPDVPF